MRDTPVPKISDDAAGDGDVVHDITLDKPSLDISTARLPLYAGIESCDGKLIWRRGCVLMLLMLMGAIGLLYPFPCDGLIWANVFNLAHAPAFAALLLVITGLQQPSAVGMQRWGKDVRRISQPELLSMAALLAVLGVAGEYAQRFSGRNSSWGDVLANSSGLLAALMLVLGIRRSGGLRVVFLVASAAVMVFASWGPLQGICEGIRQRVAMPQVASFERETELLSWQGRRSRIQLSDQWAQDGEYSMRVDLQKAWLPGVNLVWPVSDWRGYSSLTFDVYNPGNHDLLMTLKLQDQAHAASGYDPADRYEYRFVVPAATAEHVVVDLQAAALLSSGRVMDLSSIARLELFASDLDQPATVFLDSVVLRE